MTILRKLAENPDLRMDVPALLASSELPLEAFANAVRQFTAAGLVVTQTQEGREIASLTPAGKGAADRVWALCGV
jgi:hypothetical protein